MSGSVDSGEELHHTNETLPSSSVLYHLDGYRNRELIVVVIFFLCGPSSLILDKAGRLLFKLSLDKDLDPKDGLMSGDP